MKLVLIADTFPPLRSSGAVQLRDLARAFVQQGHDLTVLLPAPGQTAPWTLESSDGARVLRLKSPRTKDIGYIRRTLGEWFMPHAMRANLRKSPLAHETWDGVIWYSPSIFFAPLVAALKRRCRCKGYLIIRDIFPEWAVDLGVMRRGPAYLVFKQIARQQYDAADIIGVQTPGNLAYFRDWQRSGQGRSLEVLQNWLGAAGRAPCPIRIAQTPLAGRIVFVYAGNMGVAQGMDILLDLAGRFQPRRDVGFLFVGRGRDATRLRDHAAARGLDNVVFRDEIDPDEIPDLYAQCQVGIVALDPRHKSHNIPGKFLTYMQSGLPVLAVVNRGNDLASIIRQEQVGEVCETGDLDELLRQSLALIDRIQTDTDVADRCKALFDKQFSADLAARQIIMALGTDPGRKPD